MDHDRLFKELLTIFFREFIELFVPDVAALMGPEPVEFLDKEVFNDITAGERREVDMLAKVRFRDRSEAYFLIHVENQATAQEHFAERMFRYFARLHEKYALPVFPVALLSYDRPYRKEPDRYRVDFPGHRVLDFKFRIIQLNRLDWKSYVRNPNPVASALMTKMRIAAKGRPKVKLECLRMIATLKVDRARATLIATFMDSYLKLTAAETIVYNQERESLSPLEREVVMEWTNEWIRQGKEEGVAVGERQGEQRVLLRQLRSRFGAAADGLSDSLSKLRIEQLEAFAAAIFDFNSLEDASKWLAARQ